MGRLAWPSSLHGTLAMLWWSSPLQRVDLASSSVGALVGISVSISTDLGVGLGVGRSVGRGVSLGIGLSVGLSVGSDKSSSYEPPDYYIGK